MGINQPLMKMVKSHSSPPRLSEPLESYPVERSVPHSSGVPVASMAVTTATLLNRWRRLTSGKGQGFTTTMTADKDGLRLTRSRST